MFANALYRRAADELGSLPGQELTMLSVDAWRMNGREMPFEPVLAGAPYATVIGHAGWRGYENRGFYRDGILRAMKLSRPEAIFLMEEPFSIFAAQVLSARALMAPSIPVVFFTWNNLSYEKFDYRPSIVYRSIARAALKRMQYGLTANKAGEELLQRAGFHGPTKTIGYGVDATIYGSARSENVAAIRKRLNLRPEDRAVGYVGRLLHMKGIDLLLEAHAKRKVHETGVKIVLIGGGEEETRLLQLANELGIQDDVRYVPTVHHSEVPDYMHALDVLVLPSRRVGMWAEQFGRVLIEAMAAGKIVIGSSSGAIPEVIGDAGIVFKENDSTDLALKLTEALTLSDQERDALRHRGYERVRHYSWSRFARDAAEALEYCHLRQS